MADVVKAGVGTTFAVGNGASPEVFTTIAKITSISGPDISAEVIDVTALDAAGGYKETITGLKEGGTLTLEMNYVNNTQQNQLATDLDNNTEKNYRIEIPTTPTRRYDFAATPSGFSQSMEPNAALTATVTFTISGAVTRSDA